MATSNLLKVGAHSNLINSHVWTAEVRVTLEPSRRRECLPLPEGPSLQTTASVMLYDAGAGNLLT